MRPRLDLTAALIEAIPELSLEALKRSTGNRHVAERQAYLIHLAQCCYANVRPHSMEPGAAFFTRDELVTGLRMSKESYTDAMRVVFLFPQGHSGFSAAYKRTKWYKLWPHVRVALDAIYEGRTAVPVVDTDTGRLVSRLDPPTNGIPGSLGLPFQVPFVFPLSAKDADDAVDSVKHRIEREGLDAPLYTDRRDGWTLARALDRLKTCRMWVRSYGGIPNGLALQTTGRLEPADPEPPHIITLPSVLRRLLLASSSLVSFDIRACYWSIFVALATAHGLPSQMSLHYLANREECHRQLERETGAGAAAIKKALLIQLTGGPVSASKFTAIGKLLGRDGVCAFRRNSFVRDLKTETSSGMRTLIERAATGSRKLVNAVGMPLDLTDTKHSQQAAHLLMGVEQAAIRAMCAQAVGLRGVIYDAMIAAPQNTAALEKTADAYFRETFGFPLRLRLVAEPFAASASQAS